MGLKWGDNEVKLANEAQLPDNMPLDPSERGKGIRDEATSLGEMVESDTLRCASRDVPSVGRVRIMGGRGKIDAGEEYAPVRQSEKKREESLKGGACLGKLSQRVRSSFVGLGKVDASGEHAIVSKVPFEKKGSELRPTRRDNDREGVQQIKGGGRGERPPRSVGLRMAEAFGQKGQVGTE